MEGIFAALALLMSVISGSPHATDTGGMHADVSEITVNSTANVSIAPHAIVERMDKCDKITDNDNRNMCYAKASRDSFFCDRIKDDALSSECNSRFSSH